MNVTVSTFFELGLPLNFEENRQVEFKEIKPGNKNPVKAIANKSAEYVVAFLNDIPSLGGSVYWGVRDNDHAVMGVILNASERDDLRKTVTSILDKIQPVLTPNAYHLTLHQVVNSDGERVENTFVVELSVKAHENRSIYFAGGKHAYIKNDSGRKELSGLELVDEIKRRERIVSRNTVLWDISDYLQLLKEVKPILFWIDKEINKNDAPVFFSAPQVLFHGNHRFFEKVNDGCLRQVYDNVSDTGNNRIRSDTEFFWQQGFVAGFGATTPPHVSGKLFRPRHWKASGSSASNPIPPGARPSATHDGCLFTAAGIK